MTRVQYVKTFFVFFIVVFTAFACSQGAQESTESTESKGLTPGEKAFEARQVQNVMSKHAYYHAAGLHLEELEAIWVDEDGEYGDSASWGGMQDMQGIAEIKELYGQGKLESKKQALEKISKIYPEIENVPENLGAGSEYVIHTQTTPIIEVAGDGKTAKGVWYSPGIGLTPRFTDGGVDVNGIFFWEKYGADFIKEDGEWKLWHIAMYYDFTPMLPESMTANLGTSPQGGEQAAGGPPGGPPPEGEAPEGGPPQGGGQAGENTGGEREYRNWDPTFVPFIAPRFPEPYYTFSETFSY